jgi:glutamyl/glutaminyl-tRNA synthetase
MNTPSQQALWQALDFGELPKYAHMSVTISESGGKLSKRERPQALLKAIKARPDIYLEKLADVGGIDAKQLKDFLADESTPDVPAVEAMAKYLGVELPEINVVDFFKSGYIPEAMVNFLALLGWSTGDKKEIMPLDELIACFDITRLTKSNSLFDRGKLVAFNTEHIKMLPKEKLLGHLKAYLKAIDSPVAKANDELLLRLIKICEGARTLADIEHKCRFLFVVNDQIEYDQKAVQKVLLKDNGLAMLEIVRDKLAPMGEFTEQGIEELLRSLAQEHNVGLGKVAQPLRVAITGTTISPPIFDSVQLLGKQNTLARIDNTLSKFGGKQL